MKRSKRNLSALLSFVMSIVSFGAKPTQALSEFDSYDLDGDNQVFPEVPEDETNEWSDGNLSSLPVLVPILGGLGATGYVGYFYRKSGIRAKACLNGTALFMSDREKKLVYDIVSTMPYESRVAYGLGGALQNYNSFKDLSEERKRELHVQAIKSALMYSFLNKMDNSYSGEKANNLNPILFYIIGKDNKYPKLNLGLDALTQSLAFGVECVEKIVKGEVVLQNLNDQEKKELTKIKEVISYISKLENKDICNLCKKVKNRCIVVGDDDKNQGKKTVIWYKTKPDGNLDGIGTVVKGIDNIKIDS